MVPVRVSYYVMANEVEKLFQKDINPTNKVIGDHVSLISEFIKSCGWSEEEYWERWMAEGEIDGKPQLLS